MIRASAPASFHRESSASAAQKSSLNSGLNPGEIQFLPGYPVGELCLSFHVSFPDLTENDLYEDKWRHAARTAGLQDRWGPSSSYVLIMFWN